MQPRGRVDLDLTAFAQEVVHNLQPRFCGAGLRVREERNCPDRTPRSLINQAPPGSEFKNPNVATLVGKALSKPRHLKERRVSWSRSMTGVWDFSSSLGRRCSVSSRGLLRPRKLLGKHSPCSTAEPGLADTHEVQEMQMERASAIQCSEQQPLLFSPSVPNPYRTQTVYPPIETQASPTWNNLERPPCCRSSRRRSAPGVSRRLAGEESGGRLQLCGLG